MKKIISMTNAGQIPMMKNMINSADSVGIPMDLFEVYIFNKIDKASAFWTMDFFNITRRKLVLIKDVVSGMNDGDIVMWVDNDIVFFENPIQNLLGYNADFVMQDDLFTECTGFWTIRKSSNTVALLGKAIEFMDNNRNEKMHDQTAFHSVLHKTMHSCTLSILPRDEYPVGDVYFKHNIDKTKSRILHNNFLFTADEKVERFKANNLWNPSDDGFNKVKVLYIQ
jgi:hypothetical protein